MKKIFLQLLCCLSLILFSCENDSSSPDGSTNQAKNILLAKEWFRVYEEKEEFHPAFENIDYYWENATITPLENNSFAIAVPMKDNPENKDYRGKKMLYLYPTGNSYQAVVHEVFPKPEAVSYKENKKVDFKNLDSFSGYILTWNLKEGFVKGAEFENGLVVNTIPFAMIFSDDEKVKAYNLTRKAPPAPPLELDPVVITGGTGGGGCIGCGGVIRFTPTIGGAMGGGTGGYIGSPNGGGSSISAPSPAQIIDALTGKAKCLNDLLSKNGNTFVQKLLANFQGVSRFDISIASKEKVTVTNNGITEEINAKTVPPVGNLISIEISTSKAEINSALDVTRTILHEYIHADIFRKLETKLEKDKESLDFKSTYEAYKNQHSTMAILYIQGMKEALKEFHKTILKDDYNKYTQYYGEEPSDAFYEALSWGGLKDANVKAWTDLPADKKAAIEALAKRVPMLSKKVPCTN